jgi:DNA-binding NtrC family response regulator
MSKGLQTSDSRQTLKEVELLAIRDALEKCNGNKSKAAKILGISRKALYKRLSDEGKCFQSGQIDPQ